MELRRYLTIMRRWAWLLALGTFLATLAAYLVVASTPPQYRATATLWVTSSGQPGVYVSATDLENFTQTYAQLMTSAGVLQQALDSIQDPTSLAVLAEDVSVKALPRTAVLQISVTDPNPERARLLANAIASAFVAKPVSAVTSVSIASPADLPTTPADVSKGLVSVVLAGLFGLTAAAAASVALEYLDDRIKSLQDVESVVGIPLLSALPPGGHNLPSRGLVVTTHPMHRLAEEYRRLRAGVLHALEAEMPVSLLVTSPMADADKGAVLLNLAAALGEAGKRVLVVDADFRRPWLHLALRLPGTVGLADLVEKGDVAIDDVVQPLDARGVSVLPVGTVPRNPSAAISSARVESLLQQLQQRADVVLVGCAPVLAASHASTLARYARKALLLVDAQRERRADVARSRDALERAGATVLGAVLANAGGAQLSYHAEPHHLAPQRWEQAGPGRASGPGLPRAAEGATGGLQGATPDRLNSGGSG